MKVFFIKSDDIIYKTLTKILSLFDVDIFEVDIQKNYYELDYIEVSFLCATNVNFELVIECLKRRQFVFNFIYYQSFIYDLIRVSFDISKVFENYSIRLLIELFHNFKNSPEKLVSNLNAYYTDIIIKLEELTIIDQELRLAFDKYINKKISKEDLDIIKMLCEIVHSNLVKRIK